MVNKESGRGYVLICLIVLALMPQLAAAGSLVASVERKTVIDGESVMLYVKGENLRELPDVSVLSRDFDVLDSRRSNSQVIEQGAVKSSFMMRFELLPKHLGQVEIPAFSADGETSQPIRIDVVERGTSGVAPRDKVFAEITFDEENPYVQSQVIMSLHILDDGSLATLDPQPPEIPDVQVERLPVADQRIEQRDGVDYRVHTWRYALFPQRNGEIEIPRMKIPGSVKDASYGGNLILRNMATRRISIRTAAATLNVRPKPAESTADWWLPVEQLQLTHKWSADISNSVVGEPLTLTVALTTKGATSNQLPEIIPPDIVGLKIYPDVADLVSQPGDDGLISRRTEKWSVIPLREGVLKMPPVTIKWWDTKAQAERTATLPEQELIVVAAQTDGTAADSQVQSSTAPTRPPQEGVQADALSVTPAAVENLTGPAQDNTPAATTVPSLLPARSSIWMWIALLAVSGWVVTLVSWWYRSRQRGSSGPAAEQVSAVADSAQGLRKLRAVSNGDSAAVFRQALMDWARSHWVNAVPVSPAEIGSRLQNAALEDQLRQLDSSIYGKQGTDVSLRGIYATLTTALEQHDKPVRAVDPLPRL